MTIIKQIAVQMLLLTLASKVTLAVHNFGPAFTCITSGSLQPAQLSLYKPLPVPAPAAAPSPLQPHVIGSSNLIYVSLEIEILTFALYSGDFTASSGTKLENFMGSE